ncbi:uroporphyrinogen decarboxylase [Candidatus Acetothermia bacterium]|nr:uroporphyrinogen decarboxylase [Candidatus Acetothermia bacterium]MBI3643041.1 uroporphyrinogen decarboxylase [Candidatus Acetothermia bacterium]
MRSDRFLLACNRKPVDATPIWIMRQAGRYLKEYRDIREEFDFLTLCKTPEAAARVTLLPIEKFDLDAAILFADIMLPLEGMGIDFDIVESVGPVIEKPVRTLADLRRLRVGHPEESVPYVLETVRLARQRLAGRVPLIGFAGAPFTLASYIIEGKPSKEFILTKRLMLTEPITWHALMELLTETVSEYLKAQIKAGAQAVQLFDSWVGALAPKDYSEFVLPYTKRIFSVLKECNVPRIHFGVITASLLEQIKETGADVIGVDWRIPLDQAWNVIGYDKSIQGNLDPVVLFASHDVVQNHVEEILRQANNRPGHIFNLGHGIMPDTPPENVAFLIDLVHRLSANERAKA